MSGLIGYTELRTDLPGGRAANVSTMRACVARADGAGRRELAPELAAAADTWTQFAGWSPDGRQAIVVCGWESRENAAWEEEHRTFRMAPGAWLVDTWLVDLATGRAVNVTAVERVSHYNAGLFFWPGDPGRLGFTALIDGESRPFGMRRDGTGKHDLSQQPGFAYGFSASPDGRRIAYHQDYQVYLADADGKNARQVETGHPFNFCPAWSPDGRWVEFLSGEHYNCHPHLVGRDGAGLRPLADRGGYRGVTLFLDVPDYHGGSSDTPCWSPDSRRVYYTARVGEAVELMRVSLDGRSERLSLSAPGVAHYHPEVSPDGRHVLFGATRDGVRQLWIAGADGSDARPVTRLTRGHAAMWAHWQPVATAALISGPRVFVRHTAERSFIGPGTVRLAGGDLLMAAPWGRPPTDFEQLAAKHPVPTLYRSTDGGRTWREQGRMNMKWSLPGMISDGGITLLRLQDRPSASSGQGRLAFLSHRHVQGLHGGGLPVISFSVDEGATWEPARTIGEPEGVWYVMNDRMIQMAGGRIVVPVSHMPAGMGTYEGDRNLGLCFFSDDGGLTWRRSARPADLADARGMAEPCVAEVGNGRLLMLARTGSGSHHASWPADGGDTWSAPVPTTLTAACSPLTLKTLPDAHSTGSGQARLIVFYNHAEPLDPGAFFPRTPLCYAVSADGGRTWDAPVVVDDEGVAARDRQLIYPSICFTPEGMAVVYSVHAADPQGGWSNGGPEGWKIGGGKCCVVAYPSGRA